MKNIIEYLIYILKLCFHWFCFVFSALSIVISLLITPFEFEYIDGTLSLINFSLFFSVVISLVHFLIIGQKENSEKYEIKVGTRALMTGKEIRIHSDSSSLEKSVIKK